MPKPKKIPSKTEEISPEFEDAMNNLADYINNNMIYSPQVKKCCVALQILQMHAYDEKLVFEFTDERERGLFVHMMSYDRLSELISILQNLLDYKKAGDAAESVKEMFI